MTPTIISPAAYRNLSDWLRRHWLAGSLIILLFSTAPRLFLTWRADPPELVILISDAGDYLAPAQNLIKQKAFLNKKGRPEVTRTPGYPAFLAAIMLVVPNDLRKLLMIQAFILSFEVVVLYWFARRILPPVTALIAGLLAASSPWGAVHAGLLLTEGLFLLLLAMIFFIMKVTAEAKNQVAIAVGGACTGLLTAGAVLVRPIWPLVLLIGGVLLFLYGPKRKGAWLLLLTMLACAATPIFLWKARNQHIAQYNGLSDIAGACVSRYLVSRVRAHINNQDRWTVVRQTGEAEGSWKLSIQKADQERWRLGKEVFREHPVLTSYYFLLSAAEHAIHPSPDVLSPAKLNFRGDYWVLALFWSGLLILACFGWRRNSDPGFEGDTTDRDWLSGTLIVCLLLTLSSGLSFGAGSRFRVSLEVIVPLLAAAGLSRMIFHQSSGQRQLESSKRSLK